MIRKIVLLTSLACAFQSNIEASHLKPIIDFIQRHDEISIEYKYNPELNEESIELEGIGQSLGAYNRNGEIDIFMSGPNGQENVWIIDEDIEEIWTFLKHIVETLVTTQPVYVKIIVPIETLRNLVKIYTAFFNWQPAV